MKKPDFSRFRFRRDPEHKRARLWQRSRTEANSTKRVHLWQRLRTAPQRLSTLPLVRSLCTEANGTKRTKYALLWRRLRTVPLATMVLLAFIATSTLMYMTATSDIEINTFSIGTADVTIVETNVNSSSVSWGSNNKPVSIQNTGEIDGVVRVMFVPVLTDGDGNVVAGDLGDMPSSISGDTIVLGDITLHLASNWSSYWIYKDGYFYYNSVLEVGNTTQTLLTGVTLTNGELTDVSLADSVTVTIDVLADILQTSGNALNEWGLTVSEEGVVSSTS